MMAKILANVIYLWCYVPDKGNQHLGLGKLDVEDPFAEMVPHIESLSKGQCQKKSESHQIGSFDLELAQNKISTGILCRTSAQKPLDTIQVCETPFCQHSLLPKSYVFTLSSTII